MKAFLKCPLIILSGYTQFTTSNAKNKNKFDVKSETKIQVSEMTSK
jgi:hypothetical protein